MPDVEVVVVIPPRLAELEAIAKTRLMTSEELAEMRDLGAAVRAGVDQARAELSALEDGTER